jgi:hypothetical protein
VRYPTKIRPHWIPLHLAPFTLRRMQEPCARDLELDAELERALAVDAPDHMLVRADWSAGLIEVLARDPVDDDMGPGDGYRVCVSSHPALFRSAASRTSPSASAMLCAGLVDAFWSALISRHSALIVGDVLAVHARGGPRPVDGFREVPADVWASSSIDWAAGTCTSPDGHVYFSIHVARSEPPSPRPGDEGGPTATGRQTPCDVGAPGVVSTGDVEGMDVRAASRFLGVSKSSLDKWRLTGNGPPFHRIGARVRYLKSELEGWRNRRRDPGRSI